METISPYLSYAPVAHKNWKIAWRCSKRKNGSLLFKRQDKRAPQADAWPPNAQTNKFWTISFNEPNLVSKEEKCLADVKLFVRRL